MELNLHKQAVLVSEVVYDGVSEQPIECDVLLPDYCPDIQRILRCEVLPVLLSATVAGDRLAVDGMAAAHLYYLTEEGCLRHAEYKIPYTKTIELRTAPTAPSITVAQSVDYFNCRAVSPRRLDMRGAVTVTATVSGRVEEQVVCGAQGAGLQLQGETTESTVLVGQATRQMALREELELAYGKPSVGSVLRYTASASVSDYKVISGKLVTKGEIAVRILYGCEDNAAKLELMEYTLPLSAVVELEGVDEDCVCGVRYNVCTLELTAKNNDDGECRAFALEASVNACVVAHRRAVIETASDCYSTAFECKQQQKQLPLMKLMDMISESCMYRETLALPPSVKSIIELWCVVSAVTVKPEANAAVVSGRVTVCMFTYESDDTIAYYDQNREFSQKISVREDYETLVFSPTVCAETATFSMSGHEKMEVRCALQIRGAMHNRYRKNVICDITLDETRPKVRAENRLYLYYASEREPVWEIAKRYNTSVEAIEAGNRVEDATAGGRQLLLIPMK